ncbi:MAG: hypothetical protein ACP5I2_05475 [Fervidicoccaceae archaeon]|jgi:hypothetical protein
MGGKQRTTLFMGVSSATERVQKSESAGEEKGKKGGKKGSAKTS